MKPVLLFTCFVLAAALPAYAQVDAPLPPVAINTRLLLTATGGLSHPLSHYAAGNHPAASARLGAYASLSGSYRLAPRRPWAVCLSATHLRNAAARASAANRLAPPADATAPAYDADHWAVSSLLAGVQYTYAVSRRWSVELRPLALGGARVRSPHYSLTYQDGPTGAPVRQQAVATIRTTWAWQTAAAVGFALTPRVGLRLETSYFGTQREFSTEDQRITAATSSAEQPRVNTLHVGAGLSVQVGS